MIIYLQSDDPIDYHAIVVEQTAHVFLRKLFFQGMLNVVYLAWIYANIQFLIYLGEYDVPSWHSWTREQMEIR